MTNQAVVSPEPQVAELVEELLFFEEVLRVVCYNRGALQLLAEVLGGRPKRGGIVLKCKIIAISMRERSSA